LARLAWREEIENKARQLVTLQCSD